VLPNVLKARIPLCSLQNSVPICSKLLTESNGHPPPHRTSAESYRQLRLEALEREPQAFTEPPAEHNAATLETVRKRLSSSDQNFVLGAFDDGQLIGMVGFFRRGEAKVSHRGHIWGVYVARECRAKGVGRALMTELIERLRSQPGLEQVTRSQHREYCR